MQTTPSAKVLIPPISVLLPVYNAEKYVGIAIESVLNQSFKDFEFIILDDCSSDGSWRIIQEYAAQDKGIIAIKNERNLNGCNNLNKGLSLAKGKYIAKIDNDDWFTPDKLEKQFDFLESHSEVGIVGGTMEIMDEGGRVIGKRTYNQSDEEIRRKIFRYSPFSHPLVMFRKSVLDRVGYYNPTYAPADDYELYFRIGRESKFANLPDVLCRYRVVKSGITHRNIKRMELSTVAVRWLYSRDEHYCFTAVDRLYNVLHYLSIFVFPSKTKLWLFNLLRNAR